MRLSLGIRPFDILRRKVSHRKYRTVFFFIKYKQGFALIEKRKKLIARTLNFLRYSAATVVSRKKKRNDLLVTVNDCSRPIPKNRVCA